MKSIDDAVIFLSDLVSEGWIKDKTKRRALNFLYLIPHVDMLPAVHIGVGPDGMVCFAWKTEKYYADMEVSEEECVDFFFTDSCSVELYGDTVFEKVYIPHVFLEHLKKLQVG